MTQDASCEDGTEKPLRLGAMDGDDLQVLSARSQDAVFPAAEMKWQPRQKRFGLLLNRFRWEDKPAPGRKPERVQSVLAVENVLQVSSQGVDRTDADTILSLLAIELDAAEDAILLTLAGDGAVRLVVEDLEVALRDVTRPYSAVSGKVPDHPE